MRFKTPILGLAAVLLAGTAALAAGPSHQLRGEIAKLDPAARTLVVRGTSAPNKQLDFALASDAQIVSGAKTETFADLRTGEQVLVHYTQAGAKHEAQRIEVMPAKAPAKS